MGRALCKSPLHASQQGLSTVFPFRCVPSPLFSQAAMTVQHASVPVCWSLILQFLCPHWLLSVSLLFLPSPFSSLQSVMEEQVLEQFYSLLLVWYMVSTSTVPACSFSKCSSGRLLTGSQLRPFPSIAPSSGDDCVRCGGEAPSMGWQLLCRNRPFIHTGKFSLTSWFVEDSGFWVLVTQYRSV